ncbi:TolC family protein [Candidatus Saganbacteria bacterium]|uniref:TolC family protein n=1 Tax=Candidatus Saganbacteria bacterium TaxID=2575572 RepID=A0A9D6YVK7_UNCSA|nr:TolC family protein [Candidatus Saganbacteria bacterium]
MRKIFFIVIFAQLLRLSAGGITWQEVLSQAADRSNEIKSARKQLDAYRWTYYKAYSNFLPQLSANFSAGEASGSSSGVSNSVAWGISATQYLFKGLGNYNNLRSAGVNYDLYRANLQNTEADFYYNARLAFIDLYLARQNVSVRKKIRQYRADNTRMIKLFYDSGTEDKGNYLRTKAQLAEAEYNVVSAGRRLELARLKLAQLIVGDAASAEGEMKAAAVVSLPDIDVLTKSSPAYLMAKDQLELAAIAEQNTLSEFLPSVSLNGSYQKSGSAWPPSSLGKSLSLNVSLPIFPGGANFADRAIAGFQLDKAREDFAKNQKDIYFGIKEAYSNLNDAIGAYAVQKDYLNASRERARIAQAKYLSGLITYDEWDRLQNEYISNQSNLLNSEKSALAAEAGWHKAYGGYIK